MIVSKAIAEIEGESKISANDGQFSMLKPLNGQSKACGVPGDAWALPRIDGT